MPPRHAAKEQRTVKDPRERPLHPVHVDLPHDEAVLRFRSRAGLKRNGVREVAARGVEDGPLWLCEGGQALGDVVFGEGHKGTTQGRVVGPLCELDLHFCDDVGGGAHGMRWVEGFRYKLRECELCGYYGRPSACCCRELDTVL